MVFKNLKKVICVAFLLTMLSVPTLVYAASYSTTFDFIVSVEGSSRSFSKGNINLKIDSSETLNGCKSGIKIFSVSLYKKNFIFSDYIGEFDAKRNGITKNGWKNMAKGKYFFLLLKANDGARVKGSIKVTQ